MGGTSGMSEEDAHLNAAANYIRSGHYKEALNVLDGISQHSARWYFYSASANSGLGNNVTALEHAREAVRLEPQNMQYQMRAMNQKLEDVKSNAVGQMQKRQASSTSKPRRNCARRAPSARCTASS